MKALSAWMLALTLVGCGGNVVVDGNSPGTGGTTTAAGGMGAANTGASTGTSTASTGASTGTVTSSTASTGTATTTSTGTGTVSTGTASGSGGFCVPTCAQAAETGLEPCMGLPFADYGALGQCVCNNGGLFDAGGSCGVACGANLCMHKAMSKECFACAMQDCADESSACFGM